MPSRNRFLSLLEKLVGEIPADQVCRRADPPTPPDAPARPEYSKGPEYRIFLARYVGRVREDGREDESLERGSARLVRIDKGPGVGPGHGIRPLIFFSLPFGELWLDGHYGSAWREFIFLQEINRVQWERLIISEGLIPDALRPRPNNPANNNSPRPVDAAQPNTWPERGM